MAASSKWNRYECLLLKSTYSFYSLPAVRVFWSRLHAETFHHCHSKNRNLYNTELFMQKIHLLVERQCAHEMSAKEREPKVDPYCCIDGGYYIVLFYYFVSYDRMLIADTLVAQSNCWLGPWQLNFWYVRYYTILNCCSYNCFTGCRWAGLMGVIMSQWYEKLTPIWILIVSARTS